MRGNELLDKLERIDPAYIEAADAAPNKRKRVWAKWGTAAACLCLICGLAIPAMAAFSPSFYELLYAVTPATAQFFKPVQRSCEDNGIRMEVTAAYIHENTAEIYLSMQDLTGTNFDETVDLFDSYRLHTPFDCTGHCKLANYDPDTHTATFLVTLEQWDRQSIEGEKLTFSLVSSTSVPIMVGKRARIPANNNIEMPLPMPLSLIRLPIQTTIQVPAMKQSTMIMPTNTFAAVESYVFTAFILFFKVK